MSYGMPVHFQNSNGQWTDIDNSLSLAAGAYRTANPNAQAAFSSTLTSGKLFTMDHDGKSVSMSLLDTTMADQMIRGELAAEAAEPEETQPTESVEETVPEETVPLQTEPEEESKDEPETATEPVAEVTAKAESPVEETVPTESSAGLESTIPAEEMDVITEEGLSEALPESEEVPENEADLAEDETEPNVAIRFSQFANTVSTLCGWSSAELPGSLFVFIIGE